MGVSGAFLTTSMQRAPKSLYITDGYVLDSQQQCNIRVDCSTDNTKPLCRQSGTTGQQAFGDPDNCNVTLYKP
jgi:hypothetical protein